MRFGPLHTVVAQLREELTAVAVAGRIRHRFAELLRSVEIVDTGIETPDAQVLLRMGFAAHQSGAKAAKQVEALNDQSDLFYE
jgi:hypothetical protein